MATPVGHTLAGAALWALADRKKRVSVLSGVLLAAVFSNWPDIDYLFGFWVGYPNRYHHMATHSLVFAAGTGLAVAGVLMLMKRPVGEIRFYGVWTAVLTGSHLLLDWVTIDRSRPYGIQLFWPLDMYTIAPVPFLRDVHKGVTNAGFWTRLFSLHNLWTVVSEVLIFGPLFWLGLRFRKSHVEPGRSVSS